MNHHTNQPIREFGKEEPSASYVLRLGGYGIIRNSAGRIAVVQTSRGLYLPGGGQHEGESAREALAREAREECGLNVRVGYRIGVADELVYATGERTYFRKRCTFFHAEVIEDKAVEGTECDHKFIWLPVTDAVAQLTHESQRWAVHQTSVDVANKNA